MKLSSLDEIAGCAGLLQFPFKGIGLATIDSVVVEGNRIDLTKQISTIFPELMARVNGFISTDHDITTEDELILQLYKDFFPVLFRNSNFKLSAEHRIKITTEKEANTYFIDCAYALPGFVIPSNVMKTLVPNLPGLMIEFQLGN